LRRRPLCLLISLVVVSICVGVSRVAAATSAYGVAPTKSCLSKKGATFGAGFEAGLSGLSSAQRQKALAGVVGAGSPAFLYLVLGSSPGEAATIRARIEKALPRTPTAANSRSGTKGNAAWVIESSGGKRPSAKLQALVVGCLRTGTVPKGEPLLTRTAFLACMGAAGGTPDDATGLNLLWPQIPADIRASMVAEFVPGLKSQVGIEAFVLFGSDQAASVALLGRLQALLPYAGETTGHGRGVAWLTLPEGRDVTAAEAADGRRIFLSCVS
jgi:hypothetical protein